jgi:hypothetical protein
MAEEKKVTKNVKAPKKSSVFSKKVEPKKTAPKNTGELSVGSSVVAPNGKKGSVVFKEGDKVTVKFPDGSTKTLISDNLKH